MFLFRIMKIEEEIKSKFESESQKALVNLIYTFHYVNDKSKSFFKPFKITSQQYNILRILRGQYPKSASIKLLKERMLDKNSDVSRIIDRLLLKKLISRADSKLDRRQKDILISEEGLDLLSKIDINNSQNQILSNLSDDEAKQFNSLLDKVRN